ncbi:RpiB/LacA/LacB family sugar-phosphate isomerase [Catalinimonas niigatensis]|uniref:RpiB/LacA/LacB family sugar-phosphate isomerase n=1 Tax=Catalinimonas niigatensis TaxID=1397264 RepID=UPI0026669A50|nr:RpiB/LacA/LacB family sugar-phosphate isomerase [Catalinimonas niigatensis]WPP50599.1 RpiB/LacA/LacB family sugar-phosphate isomerase [Catalinimonas niigatensis]
MTIGIASDHGGYELKEKLVKLLKEDYQLNDYGAHHLNPNDDYPDYVLPLAKALASGEIDRGIAICGSGVGACMVANKIKGVRAALINETYSAHQGVEHDDMNIICIGARVVGDIYAQEIIRAFLKASYSGEERHERRLRKLKQIEQGNS